jgi:hypothetical protein
LLVVHEEDPALRGQVNPDGAGDEEDRVRAAGQEHADTALGEGLPVPFDQRLRPAEPGALPRRQQHSRNTPAHDPQAYAHALVASITNRGVTT